MQIKWFLLIGSAIGAIWLVQKGKAQAKKPPGIPTIDAILKAKDITELQKLRSAFEDEGYLKGLISYEQYSRLYEAYLKRYYEVA